MLPLARFLVNHMLMKHDVTHYDTLEVSPQACASVIKAAYRCLVQINHPDRNHGSTQTSERLAQINFAYSVLSDPYKRAHYDRSQAFCSPVRERRGRAVPTAARTPTSAPAQPGSRAFVF